MCIFRIFSPLKKRLVPLITNYEPPRTERSEEQRRITNYLVTGHWSLKESPYSPIPACNTAVLLNSSPKIPKAA